MCLIWHILTPNENNSITKFKDREHAAGLLISKLKNEVLEEENPKEIAVFGIPRGGVILANTIYKNRYANYFDIVIPRKLGKPIQRTWHRSHHG